MVNKSSHKSTGFIGIISSMKLHTQIPLFVMVFVSLKLDYTKIKFPLFSIQILTICWRLTINYTSDLPLEKKNMRNILFFNSSLSFLTIISRREDLFFHLSKFPNRISNLKIKMVSKLSCILIYLWIHS